MENMSVLLNDVLDTMFWKKNRLQTYEHWPFDAKEPCNSVSMSEAGFFCIGGQDELDLVECFICGKQLDGWESSDDPWEEHKKHQPDCSFIVLNKRDELSVTVKELFELLKSYHSRELDLQRENSIKTIKSEWENEILPNISSNLRKSSKANKSLL